MKKEFNQFDIYEIDLGQNIGSEESGIQLVTIISNNIGNKNSTTVIIAPIEPLRPKDKKKLPMHVIVNPTNENGLGLISEIQLEQTRCVSKIRFEDTVCIGKLNQDDIKKIQKAIAINYSVVNVKN